MHAFVHKLLNIIFLLTSRAFSMVSTSTPRRKRSIKPVTAASHAKQNNMVQESFKTKLSNFCTASMWHYDPFWQEKFSEGQKFQNSPDSHVASAVQETVKLEKERKSQNLPMGFQFGSKIQWGLQHQHTLNKISWGFDIQRVFFSKGVTDFGHLRMHGNLLS